MSRAARRTAETAAIALVIATGAAGGAIAASLAADGYGDGGIAPAAQQQYVAPAPSVENPSAGRAPAPVAPHTSRSS